MRRRLVVALLASFAFLVTVEAQAQQRPADPPRQGGGRPGTGGGGVTPQACGEGCGEGDEIAPWITLNAPGTEVTVQYPYVEIEWCDNTGLDATSRWIKLNGSTVTGSFTYQNLTPLDCGERRKSASSSVAFQLGANTLEARICDGYGNCTTQTWTINRVQPAKPIVALRNHNGENLDRGLCLTMGAGQAAGLSCGDLFVSHGLPAYRTMGRDRALTLFYNSAAARRRGRGWQ